MKHLFVINPAAGSRDHSKEYREQIEAVCTARGIAYEIFVSQAPGQCREAARNAAQTGELHEL